MIILPEALAEIRRRHRIAEADAVAELRVAAPAASPAVEATALQLARKVRASTPGPLSAESFLRSYGLSTREGVALMCIAEALLRIPDAATADALLRDKLAQGDWGSTPADSLIANAADWALLLTGKLARWHEEPSPLKHIVAPKVTLDYDGTERQDPRKAHTPRPGYRGEHYLKKDDAGHVKCVACFMCAAACPAECIHIEAQPAPADWKDRERVPKRFEIDMLRCIYCGMCEEACPKDAIWLRKDYELAAYSRLEMQFGKWDLMNTYADEDGKLKLKADPTPAVPRPPVRL